MAKSRKMTGDFAMKRLKDFSEMDRERYSDIWKKLENHIDEKTKRLLAAAMSLSLGYGGNKILTFAPLKKP